MQASATTEFLESADHSKVAERGSVWVLYYTDQSQTEPRITQVPIGFSEWLIMYAIALETDMALGTVAYWKAYAHQSAHDAMKDAEQTGFQYIPPRELLFLRQVALDTRQELRSEQQDIAVTHEARSMNKIVGDYHFYKKQLALLRL